MGNLSLQDLPIPFEEKETFFLEKNYAEKTPTSFDNTVLIKFKNRTYVTSLGEILRNIGECYESDDRMSVLAYEGFDLALFNLELFKRLVEHYWNLWGQ